MNDDELLEALGARERAETERRAPEWEDLAHGRRSAEDAARAVTARSGADADEAARAQELFAPLSADFDDALAERLATAGSPARGEGERVVERRDRAFWRRTGLALGLAAAAAALVLVVVRSGPTPGGDLDTVARLRALPAFELGIAAVQATVRSDHGVPAALEVAAGDAVELLLRPAARHGELARVWSCLENDGSRTELATEIVDATAGATVVARVTIPADTAPGSWRLVAVVATDRPASDPCTLEDSPEHRVVSAALRVGERP